MTFDSIEQPRKSPGFFILVRHGETPANVGNTFRGRTDSPLNENGKAQAEAVAARIAREWQPKAVYASPVYRAMQTAQAIAERCALTVTAHPGLIDIDFGEWTGLPMDEVSRRWPVEFDQWIHHPGQLKLPGGESLGVLRERAQATMQELAARHAGESVVLVGHNVSNRAILMETLGIADDQFWYIGQDNCAINVIRTEINGRFSLLSLNDTCHLPKDHR